MKTAVLPDKREMARRIRRKYPDLDNGHWALLQLDEICRLFELVGSAVGSPVGVPLTPEKIAAKYVATAMNLHAQASTVGQPSRNFFVNGYKEIITALVDDKEVADEVSNVVDRMLFDRK